MSLSRRQILQLGAASTASLALAPLLAGCGETDAAAPSAARSPADPNRRFPGATVTVLMQNDGDPTQKAFRPQFVQPWLSRAGAAGFAFRQVPYADLDRVARQSRLGGGNPADVVNGDGPYVPGLAVTRTLSPITDQFSSEDIADFDPAVREVAEIGGEFYGMSSTRSSQALVYNREVLDRYGITPPTELADAWTWGRAREVFREVQARERQRRRTESYWALQIGNFGVPVGSYYMGQLVTRSNGEKGSPTLAGVSPDGRTASGYLDTPEAIEGLQFIRDLHQTDRVVPTSTNPDFFVRDQAAFYWTFPYEVKASIQPKKIPFGVTPLPYFKTPIINTQSFHWTVLASARQRDAAASWIGWLGRPEQMLALADYFGQLPARVSLRPRVKLFNVQPLKVFADSTYEWGGNPPLTAGFSDYSARVSSLLADVAGGADPADRAKATAQDLDRLLSRYPAIPR